MTNRTVSFVGVLALLATLLSSGPVLAGESNVHVMDAWVRDMPPSLKMTSGYMSLHNATGETRALVGVSSPQFDRVEMHLSQAVNGVATMQEVKQVDVPAGGMVAFAPEGLHLMLIGRHGVNAEKVELTLTFDDGTTATVTADLRKSPPAAHPHDHMKHGS